MEARWADMDRMDRHMVGLAQATESPRLISVALSWAL